MIIIANQDTLSLIENNEQYSGSKDYYSITFQFSSDWDDYAIKHAVFIRSETEVEDLIIPEDGRVFIPNVFLEYESAIEVGCYGVNGDVRRTTNLLNIIIEEGSYRVGTQAVPTPDVFEQYLSQMRTYAEAIDPNILEKLIPSGGNEGQVLSKASENAYDVVWADTAGSMDILDSDVLNTSSESRFNGLGTQKDINEDISDSLAQKADRSHHHDESYLGLSHGMRVDNPHEVTKAQVGLVNVDNTADSDKPVSTAQQTAINDVDQVFSYSSASAFPSIGKTEALYIAEDSNMLYRWTGSTYVYFSGDNSAGNGTATGENCLINSAGRINQRGVSGTVMLSAGEYGHDRWKAGSSGCTYTFSENENITTFTITSGSLMQVVEGLNIESGVYVLSWEGTATGSIDSGTAGGSPVSGTLSGGVNTTISFGIGTLRVPKLEKGLVATAYVLRSFEAERSRCYRYYKQLASSGVGGTAGRILQGICTSSTTGDFMIDISTFRVTPTFNYTGSWAVSDAITASTVTGISYFSVTYSDQKMVIQAVTSGRTAGRAGFFERANNTTAEAWLDAEL